MTVSTKTICIHLQCMYIYIYISYNIVPRGAVAESVGAPARTSEVNGVAACAPWAAGQVTAYCEGLADLEARPSHR